MAWGKEEEAPEQSVFASNGKAPFPPTYEDSKRIGQISQWPAKLVSSKRRQYEEFLERDDPMPRARAFAHYILEHLVFEDEYNKGEESFNIWITSKVMDGNLKKVENENSQDTRN